MAQFVHTTINTDFGAALGALEYDGTSTGEATLNNGSDYTLDNDDFLYLVDSGGAAKFSFNTTDGYATEWEIFYSFDSEADIATDGTNVFVRTGANDATVYKFNATDGSQLWNVSYTGGDSARDNVVAFGDGGCLVNDNSNSELIRYASDGSIEWRVTRYSDGVGDCAVYDDYIAVGVDNDRFYHLDKADGSLAGSGRNDTIDGDVLDLYVDKRGYAYRFGNSEIQEFDDSATFQHSTFYSGNTRLYGVDNNHVIFNQDGVLYRADKSDFSTLDWSYDTALDGPRPATFFPEYSGNREAWIVINNATGTTSSTASLGTVSNFAKTLAGGSVTPTVERAVNVFATTTSTVAAQNVATSTLVDSIGRQNVLASTESVVSGVPVAFGTKRGVSIVQAENALTSVSGASQANSSSDGVLSVGVNTRGSPTGRATPLVTAATVASEESVDTFSRSDSFAPATQSTGQTEQASVFSKSASVTGATPAVAVTAGGTVFTAVTAGVVAPHSDSTLTVDSTGRAVPVSQPTSVITEASVLGIARGLGVATPISGIVNVLIDKKRISVVDAIPTRAYPRDTYETLGIAYTTATGTVSANANSPFAREFRPRGSGTGSNERDTFEVEREPEPNPEVGDNKATADASTNTASVSVSKNSADGGNNENDATINDGEN